MAEDTPRTKVLKNGAIYDYDAGRIVALKPELAEKNTQITQANTSEFASRRQQLKRERILAGAARTLERGEWDSPSDLDVAEALGEAVMMKALNPDNAKQVDAARFILQEGGLAELRGSDQITPAAVVAGVAAGVAASMARLWDDVMRARSAEVVDGQLREVEKGEND